MAAILSRGDELTQRSEAEWRIIIDYLSVNWNQYC